MQRASGSVSIVRGLLADAAGGTESLSSNSLVVLCLCSYSYICLFISLEEMVYENTKSFLVKLYETAFIKEYGLFIMD